MKWEKKKRMIRIDRMSHRIGEKRMNGKMVYEWEQMNRMKGRGEGKGRRRGCVGRIGMNGK